MNIYSFIQNNPVSNMDPFGLCSLTVITGSQGLSPSVPGNAGGWYQANPPVLTISDNSCSGVQEGFNTTLSSCSATIWIIVDTPRVRSHEMSHYSCLQQLDSSLSSLVMDTGCECPDCPAARKAWVRAQMNYAIEQYNVCTLTRDCTDNGGSYCTALIGAQARLISRQSALQPAIQRIAAECN